MDRTPGRRPLASRVAGARWVVALVASAAFTGCGLVPQPGAELTPADQVAGTPEDAGTSGVAGPAPAPAPPSSAPPAPPAPPVAPPPAPVPPAPVPPAAGATDAAAPVPPTPETAAIEARIAELVNQARAEAGVAPLVVSAELTQASRAWTEQMVTNFGLVHDPGLAVPPGARIAGENVAYRTTAADVGANLHAQFMASQGHRENVLEPAYTSVGIGVIQSGDRTWVTERFVG